MQDISSIAASLVTTVASDIVAIQSDLVVDNALIDTIKSDLIVTNAIVDSILSDLIVTNAIVDTIVSDLVISQSDIKVITTNVDSTLSDLIVTNAIVDSILSDLIVTNALVDGEVIKTVTIASDLVITQSDIKVITTNVDGIKSDLIISQSDIKIISANVDAEIVKTTTIASDLVISQSDIKIISGNADTLIVQATVGTATGDADIDISEYVYTGYINCLTVTAPATGLVDCRIDIDFNKVTTGWDTIATAADTLDCVLVAQVDGTNYRSTQLASAQIIANGDGSLDASESGVSFHTGPLAAAESVQVHVKMSAERGDCELPYRVTYVGAAPTITPIAAV